MQDRLGQVSVKDTVRDLSSLDVSLLAEMKLDEFPKAARIVIVNCFSISESLHDWTAQIKRDRLALVLPVNTVYDVVII